MSGQRKWRPIPPPPPPMVVLDERIGPHLVLVEAFEHDDGSPIITSTGAVGRASRVTTMYRAIQICGRSRSTVGVWAFNAEEALVQAARCLGYEPVNEKEQP
jgi:hypothetical protein